MCVIVIRACLYRSVALYWPSLTRSTITSVTLCRCPESIKEKEGSPGRTGVRLPVNDATHTRLHRRHHLSIHRTAEELGLSNWGTPKKQVDESEFAAKLNPKSEYDTMDMILEVK